MIQKANYVAFDVETGGFEPTQNPIVQIAMVAMDGNTLDEIDRYETFIKPYDNLVLTKGSFETHHLSPTDIENGLSKKDAQNEIASFLNRNSVSRNMGKRPIMVAHNANFDMKFLRHLFESSNKPFSDRKGGIVHDQAICTMVMGKMFIPNIKSLALESLCDVLEVELGRAHHAMYDTVACADVFRKLTLLMRHGEIKTSSSKVKKKRETFQF